MLIPPATWNWIRHLNRVPDEELVFSITDRILRDFDQVFEAIKTQKVLSRSRDINRTREHCEAIRRWAMEAPLSGACRSKLIRHCQITIFLQEAATELRYRTSRLKIWRLSYPELCKLIFISLENFDRELVKNAGDSFEEASSSEEFYNIIFSRGHVLRTSLDLGIMIINEGRTRCSENGSGEFMKTTALNEALELANDTDRLFQAWNAYSFSEAQVRLDEQIFRIYRPNPSELAITGHYNRRLQVYDLTAKQDYGIKYRDSHAQAVEELSRKSHASFGEYLKSDTAANFFEATTGAVNLQKREMRVQIAAFVDISQEVKIGAHKFTYEEVLDTWIGIYRLAELGAVWIKNRIGTDFQSPATEVSERELCGFMRNEMGDKYRDEILEMFISRRSARGFQDFFYKPLVEMETGKIYVSSTLVKLSRFDRNLLHIVARDVNESLSEKGRRPVLQIMDLFRRENFKVISNLPVSNRDGGVRTDLDIAVYKDRHLFLFQCKMMSLSDTIYELWKNSQTLESAAIQMDQTLEWVKQEPCDLFERFGITRDVKIIPFLLTNIITHSGMKVGGYSVVDLQHIANILRGAPQRAIDPATGQEISRTRLIKGHPSGEELAHFAGKLTNRKLLAKVKIVNSELRIGSKLFLMPAEHFDSASNLSKEPWADVFKD